MDFRAFASRMEQAFRCDFADVRIQVGHSAEAMLRSRAALAGVRNATIFLSDMFFRLPDNAREFVLAHEFAHIVQKRLPATLAAGNTVSIPRARALEFEANTAAAVALAGGYVRCVLPDVPPRLATWEAAGHYYTSLLVMLAAGLDKARSFRCAFFCQMPDQVDEFDAKAAGIDIGEEAALSGSSELFLREGQLVNATSTWRFLPKRSILFQIWDEAELLIDNAIRENSSYYTNRINHDLRVQEGLHCLNGHRGEDETNFRQGQLLSTYGDDVKFGLALHAYGDSFAHRKKDGMLYSPILGHTLDSLTGSDPDNIQGHASVYWQYINSLYATIRYLSGNSARLGPDGLDTLNKILGTVLNLSFKLDKTMTFTFADSEVTNTESQDCGRLREIMVRLKLCSYNDFEYWPELQTDTIPWVDFSKKYARFLTDVNSNIPSIVNKFIMESTTYMS